MDTMSRAERREAARQAVEKALADSDALEELAPRVLEAIGTATGWDIGAVWVLGEGGEALHCLTVWKQAGVDAEQFEARTRHMTFPSGIGLPGTVWASGEPVWIRDVGTDQNFPRGPWATRANLHAAIGFPLTGREGVLGVIEFFSKEIQPPDEAMLADFAELGERMGSFIEAPARGP
jgi:two-component system cell cycle sensor histidine kinase/response regulator CckA